MTQTPRTDAAEMPIDRVDTLASRPCSVVNADFARTLELETIELKRQLAEAQSKAEMLDYLQNAEVIHAQSFFWNYSSRKQRAEAIRQAIQEQKK